MARKASKVTKGLLTNYLFAILGAAFFALLLRIYAIEAYRIPTSLMSPTLLPGDHIFVNKLAYGGSFGTELKPPARGDVVIINLTANRKKDYIKRVIGVPGDRVGLEDGIVVLNGKRIGEGEGLDSDSVVENLDGRVYYPSWPGVTAAEKLNLSTVKVPPGHVFVLSDNRSNGQDSRTWGFLPFKSIKGKAWWIWLSVSPEKQGKTSAIQWSRMFRTIR